MRLRGASCALVAAALLVACGDSPAQKLLGQTFESETAAIDSGS